MGAAGLALPHRAPLNEDQHRIAIDLERPFFQPIAIGTPGRRGDGKLTSPEQKRIAPRDYCLFQSAWHHDQRLRKGVARRDNKLHQLRKC